jgi:DNA-binding protein HU-beta
VEKFVGEFDPGKYFLRRRVFQLSRLLMLARLLQVRALRGTVERELTLFTTALRADASMDGQAKAFFLSVTANGAAQRWYSTGQMIGPNLPLWHFHQRAGPPDPHGQWLCEHDLWKNRIKYGENVSHAIEVGVRYAQLEHFYCSNFQGGLLMATGMTKTQLVRHMAEKHEMNNKQTAAFLESLAEVAIKETKKNGVFVVPGLGRLVKSNRKARMGRNPQTGEAIKIPAKVVVKFRVAKAAKDAIAPKK